MISKKWLSRRWYDFRVGYSNYLGLIFGFSNFLINVYTYVLLFGGFVLELIPTIFHFAFFGGVSAVVLGVLFGHFHNTRQLKTEVAVQIAQNPFYKQILDKLDELEKEVKNRG